MVPTEESLRAFFEGHLEHPERIVTEVHPEDDMFRYALMSASGDSVGALVDYMAHGLSVLATLRQIVALHFGSWENVGRVLDFAAGFGRVTRMLRHDLPADSLWASEIDAVALSFLSESLGVRTFPSARSPSELVCDERFDLILVSSLFSHLPERLFVSWLQRLVGLVTPEGLLAFSVRDESLRPRGWRMPRSGMLFEPASGSHVLDTEIYGTTWVTERFVRSACKRTAPGRSCIRMPRGHCGYQDLYLVLKERQEGDDGPTVPCG